MSTLSPGGDSTDARRKRLGIGITVALFALFGVLLGPLVLDAIDTDHPSREVVLVKAATAGSVPVKVDSGAEDSPQVREALATLPDYFVALLERHRASVSLVSLEALNGRGFARDDTLFHTAGLFVRNGFELLIAHDSEHPGLVALHEYGHFVDAALGDCSQKPEFGAIFHRARERGETGRYYLGASVELFAHFFGEYYYSDRRRARLEREYPDGFAFLSRLESGGRCD